MRHSRTAKNETRNKNNSTQSHANNKARGAILKDGTPQRGRLTFIYVNR